ncbi:MAG: hypothetical protein QG619_874 [Pseudomonadota bacterium]|nr:hypothetical protein [Pseudomonadota bacterium]
MPHLTTESIRRHKAPSERVTRADSHTRGLYLVLEPTGTKRFLLRYKVDGKTYRHALGIFGEAGDVGRITLDQARTLVNDWRDRIKNGEYPHAVQQLERQQHDADRLARAAAPTVADLADRFKTKYLDKQTRRADARMITFNKHVIPQLGTMKIAAVRRAHLNALLDDVTDQGHGVAAYGLARLLGQMFRFAVDEEMLEATPAERLKKGTPAAERDRVLSEDELRKLWIALDTGKLPMTATIRLGLRVLLLTGARAGELCAARWDDFRLDGDMPQWTIPKTVSKNGIAHAIPLGPTALTLLGDLHKMTGDTEYVMPAGDKLMASKRTKPRKRPPTAHLDSHAIAVALRRCHKHGKIPDVAPFSAHDLRRTMRTGLVRLGISTELAERVIGHKPRSALVRTYDLYDRLPERRRALIDWDREVQRIIAGKSNVTKVARKAAL